MIETKPEWYPWVLGRFHPDQCGGHSFMYNPVELNDLRRMSEKAYYSGGGKFQVVHCHPAGTACGDSCEVFGIESEVPRLG